MKPRSITGDQRGQAMVEFVIVVPILLLLVFGVVQFGILYNNYQTLTDAVRAGARQAAVSRSLPDPVGSADARVRKAASDLDTDPSVLEVTVEPFDPASGAHDWVQGGDVTVTARYPYKFQLFGFPVASGHLTSKTTERVE